MLMEYRVGIISSAGGRKNNEDYCSYEKTDDGCLLALADGLGGHGGGEVASKMAVEAAMECMKNGGSINESFAAAQKIVLKTQEQNSRLKAMRTTLVLACIKDGILQFGHIGDSRLYVFREGKVQFITPDHSVTYVLYKTGEISFKKIRHDPNRNKVLRVVGEAEAFNPQIGENTKLKTGDAVLLCTDGFWEHVTEKEMEKYLLKSNTPSRWLEKMQKRVLRRAKKGYDNYSAIAVMV